jgi:hypothetical protein
LVPPFDSLPMALAACEVFASWSTRNTPFGVVFTY